MLTIEKQLLRLREQLVQERNELVALLKILEPGTSLYATHLEDLGRVEALLDKLERAGHTVPKLPRNNGKD